MKLFVKYHELKPCIVNLKSGTSFKCLIYSDARGMMILKNVEILSDRGAKTKPTRVDGDVVVIKNDVDFVQIIV